MKLSKALFPLLTSALLLSGCGRNMYDQARYESYEPSSLFADGTSARPIPEGTVSRERGAIEESFFTGQDENGLLTELPIPLTQAVLERGQERYNIYCAVCHNYSGDGGGIIVQRGFVQPASFHEPRLRAAPVGYFYNAITNGFGRMYSYASRIPPEDRWAIAAYIRALQLSQSATVADLPADLQAQLQAAAGRAQNATPSDTLLTQGDAQ
jgi:mono/diheme cytochrome c family protein